MSAIVLLSGGLDSAICLHLALERGCSLNVRAIAIDYGQRHTTELVSARRIARRAGVELLEVTAKIPWQASALTGGGGDVVVPGRNAILATIAAAHVPGGTVVMGCCLDDAERFPDCRPAFIDALDDMLRLALNVRLDAPLVHRTKAEALRLARTVRGAWDAVALSWSCYAPQDAGARRPTKCGTCLACVTRAAAFAEVGEPDPAR
jgi:7-cyano-7-deazaguanine synthase